METMENRNTVQLRIHHVFDIIRDIGAGREFTPHPYGHSYHLLADRLRREGDLQIRLIIENDEICRGCTHLSGGQCTDTISHRTDFSMKQDFNDYLDRRILSCLGIDAGLVLPFRELLSLGGRYLDQIEEIYRGNDRDNTLRRAENVRRGLEQLR